MPPPPQAGCSAEHLLLTDLQGGHRERGSAGRRRGERGLRGFRLAQTKWFCERKDAPPPFCLPEEFLGKLPGKTKPPFPPPPARESTFLLKAVISSGCLSREGFCFAACPVCAIPQQATHPTQWPPHWEPWQKPPGLPGSIEPQLGKGKAPTAHRGGPGTTSCGLLDARVEWVLQCARLDVHA